MANVLKCEVKSASELVDDYASKVSEKTSRNFVLNVGVLIIVLINSYMLYHMKSEQNKKIKQIDAIQIEVDKLESNHK